MFPLQRLKFFIFFRSSPIAVHIARSNQWYHLCQSFPRRSSYPIPGLPLRRNSRFKFYSHSVSEIERVGLYKTKRDTARPIPQIYGSSYICQVYWRSHSQGEASFSAQWLSREALDIDSFQVGINHHATSHSQVSQQAKTPQKNLVVVQAMATQNASLKRANLSELSILNPEAVCRVISKPGLLTCLLS